MNMVFGLGTRLRVHMRTKLENGVLHNGQQPQGVVNGSLVPRPKEEEEKGPGFSRSRMRLIAVIPRLRILLIYFRTLVTQESILNVTLSQGRSHQNLSGQDNS